MCAGLHAGRDPLGRIRWAMSCEGSHADVGHIELAGAPRAIVARPPVRSSGQSACFRFQDDRALAQVVDLPLGLLRCRLQHGLQSLQATPFRRERHNDHDDFTEIREGFSQTCSPQDEQIRTEILSGLSCRLRFAPGGGGTAGRRGRRCRRTAPTAAAQPPACASSRGASP